MTDIPWTWHTLTLEKNVFRCAVCGKVSDKEPHTRCPGLPIYSYQDWSHGLLTQKQLGEKGFQTGKNLPAPVGLVPRSKSPDGYLRLYDSRHAVPKRQVSEEDKTARAERLTASRLCPRCKVHPRAWTRSTSYQSRGRTQWRYKFGWWDYCPYCEHAVMLEDAKAEASQWACDKLQGDWLILDCETSGLDTYFSEILEIAVINTAGNVLLNTRIKPQNREYTIESGAYDHNGIHPDELDSCPPFALVWDTLVHLLSYKKVIIYNARFDREQLRADCDRWGLPRIKFAHACAMEAYAKYLGEWSEYHESFTWQPLPAGDHTALGDCMATLGLIKQMAGVQ